MACCRLQPARYFTKALCTRHRSHTLILKSLRRIFSFRILSLSSFFAWIRFCCSAKRAEMFLSRAIIASSSRSSSLSSSPFCFSEMQKLHVTPWTSKTAPSPPLPGTALTLQEEENHGHFRANSQWGCSYLQTQNSNMGKENRCSDQWET